MDMEVTQSSASAPESAPASAPEAAPAPQTAPEAPAASTIMPPPAPELSLRQKIEKKASEVNARRSKDAKTGQFLAKTPQTTPPGVLPAAPAAQAPGAPNTQVLPTKAPETTPFVPNFKVKIHNEEKDIPEILRPLMVDEKSAKEVQDLVTKAFGLDVAKPKHELALRENESLKAQIAPITQENTAIRGQIQNLVTLYHRGDIDGWLKALGVPEERMLQHFVDKLNYSQLPPEQKAILDQRKQAEERAWQAESQVQQVQTQNQSLLTQQVQGQLESVLARPDVQAAAQAFDTRVGRPGAFRAEINRRGDYVWKTQNKLVQPDHLVQELMGFMGPAAPAAVAPSQPAPAAAAPAAPQTPTPTVPARAVPTIPNISGRSASALRPKVKSIADIRARLKEMQTSDAG